MHVSGPAQFKSVIQGSTVFDFEQGKLSDTRENKIRTGKNEDKF